MPRRTIVTCEASIAPSVGLTGNVPGSRPAGASEDPPIMPIDRGCGAPSEIARLPELRGAIATFPVSARLERSSRRSNRVTAPSPGFSTGMTSRLRFGQAQLPSGLKTTAGRSADANKTRSLCPFFDSMVACDVSTIISAPPSAAINSVRAIAIEQRKAWLATNWHL
jgi:hypothetical protein